MSLKTIFRINILPATTICMSTLSENYITAGQKNIFLRIPK